ncbi:MAG: histidinol-phosphate transaminase [Cyanobacteriota/Melainabacteria group bacterium]
MIITRGIMTRVHNPPKDLVPPHVQKLVPYKPGKPPAELQKELGIEEFINLASNENSLGPPQTVLAAIQEASQRIHRYPEVGGLKLRQALAEHYNVKVENVAIGSGSESILANTIRAFLHGDDEVITADGTFIGFYVLVNAQGIKLHKIPLKDYRFDLDAIANAINERTKVVYLCNPNNPTGTIFDREEFETFMNRVPEHVLVILDEAYYEFTKGDQDFPNSMQYRLDNVLTLRTFSKAYGMAGVRVGYGLGHEMLIDYINRIKLPFEPSVMAQAAAYAALQDKEYMDRTLENNQVGMEYLEKNLDRLGIKRVNSWANFILIELGSEEKVASTNDALLRKGIAIRPLTAFGLATCMRITVGIPQENEKLVAALEEIFAN